MNNFKCDICSTEFTTKYGLEKHTNKKNKCNIITDFQCLTCLKYFKQKKNLIEHNLKNICKKTDQLITIPKQKNINLETSEDKNDNKLDSIKSILKINTDENMKIELLKKFNITLSTDEIKIIINSELDIDEKTKLLNDFININKTTTINNGTINNGTMNNNTTNNIQINNFGKENLEHLDNEYFKDLIMNNHIQTAYMKLIEDTYLDEKHPENQTIKIDNINNKYGFVFENGKWRAILKYELKELMHEKNNKLLKIHYKRLREFLNAAKRSSINVFFSRGYDSDPHLKLMNDQMILLFYEGKPKNVI